MRQISCFVLVLCLCFILSNQSLGQVNQSELADAYYSFNNGDYNGAYSKLRQNAELGSPQAQLRLAEMYEKGLGITRNYIDAYVWYNLAAASGNSNARIARDKLESRLTNSQISKAQKKSNQLFASIKADTKTSSGSGEEILTFSYTFGSFDGKDFDRLTFKTYRPNATADNMIDDIVSYSSLPSRSFIVRATNSVPNAAAAIQGTKRYILYNPNFMRQVETSSSTSWEAYSIMAHEIGHHLAGHTLESGGSRPPTELEADYFSGGVLARMNATLQQSIAAMSKLASPTGSNTHPPRDKRIDAITRGWKQARSQMGKGSQRTETTQTQTQPQIPQPQSQPYPGPEPIQQPIPQAASVCVVGMGPGEYCAMRMRIPIGSPCTCFTAYGTFSGIAQ
ncbi:MAG: hypothetical protein GWO07_03660 [Candidatus Dadabacteria bacterium]|nr:hypothetical protein [Candidatus Dadabacteria bacterium]NIS07861.1 hypothetical protein [Candidatus Dadabacteria bacterium]NIV42833.1 hypothetical protein [Candidatus Dadabacteria bacterium]NIY21649.1 hypothetical protein [Candidatus Dadabacteria bacterium]